MNSPRISFPRRAAILAALLALACASCTTPPPANPPVVPSKPVISPTARQEAQRPKEPAPPSPPPPRISTSSKGEPDLDKGIRSYEDGEYKTSAKQLQAALDLGLDAKREQAKAHKYLAFIACTSGRKTSCRSEFNKALDADPKLDLEPAEAGHPIWGPVWRNVKAARATKSTSQ
jgi:Tfp pilus assembly protein PilF